MTSAQKLLFVADITFFILALPMLLPQCAIPLWKRLIFIALVWTINAGTFWYSQNDEWLLGHTRYFFPLCNGVAAAPLFGWLGRRKWLKRTGGS
jgi:hypothetical protein